MLVLVGCFQHFVAVNKMLDCKTCQDKHFVCGCLSVQPRAQALAIAKLARRSCSLYFLALFNLCFINPTVVFVIKVMVQSLFNSGVFLSVAC
jgi:hypothetical protein